jgi:hypothetical protein
MIYESELQTILHQTNLLQIPRVPYPDEWMPIVGVSAVIGTTITKIDERSAWSVAFANGTNIPSSNNVLLTMCTTEIVI